MNSIPEGVAEDQITSFIADAGWGDAHYESLGADMGLRRYARLTRHGTTALFMDMSRSGYEADLKAFVNIAKHFREHNIRAPEIYALDIDRGLSIIEDFGEESFGAARANGVADKEIYQRATDVLVKIRKSAKDNVLDLNGYEGTLIRKRLSQFVDYYMPLAAGRLTTQADHDEFQSVMKEIEKALPPCPVSICHADYHLENLMWCPDHDQGYGIIDFQDAFWGPQPYDLLNLLEDARQTVPDDIKQAMRAQYCEGMSVEEVEVFDAWYVYMSSHFHCRVIGLFIKFAREHGGVEFLAHIPRLQNYITTNLENPLLAPLKEFMERHKISFDCVID